LAAAVSFFLAAATSAFGYQLTFQPRISVGLEYTDNVFLDPDNAKDVNGNPLPGPVDDFIYTTTPGFTAEMLSRRSGLSLDYDFTYAAYNDFTDQNNWRHSASLSAWTEFSRGMRLEANDAFIRTEDPLGGARNFEINRPADSITPQDPTTIRSREPYSENTASLRFTHQFGRENSYFLEYVNSIRADDDPEGDDSIEHLPSAGLTYWFGPRWGTEVQGSYEHSNFDINPDIRAWYASLRMIRRLSRRLEVFGQYRHRVVDQKGDLQDLLTTTRRTLEDYKVYSPEVGMSYSISHDLAMEATAGFFYRDNDVTDSQSGFSGTFNLTKTLRRGSTRLYGAAGYGESLTSRSSLGPSKFYEIGVTANYEVIRNMQIDGFVSYRRDEYDEDQRLLLADAVAPGAVGDLSQADLGRDEDRYGAGIGMRYAFRTWLSCTLNYSYQRVNSTRDIDEYDENRATFFITLTPPRPWRTVR